MNRILLACFGWLLVASSAVAAVPEHVTLNAQVFEADSPDAKSYQGAVTVELFNVETGGAALWSEQHPDTAIERGFLSLPLGKLNTTTPLAQVLREHAGESLFVGVSLTKTGEQTGLVFPRRLALTSVPYALVCAQAGNAATLGDKSPDYYAPATASFSKVESDDRYLAKGATAADAEKLGGQLPAYYSTSTHSHDAAYLGKTAQAADSAKLENHSAGYFATKSEHDTLAGNLASLSGDLSQYYYTIAELATHFFSKEELLPVDATTPGALDSRYPFLAVGQTSNCRLDYNATTTVLSVVGRNGAALSAKNACVVAIDDEEPLVFTKPIATKFGPGAASDVDGNTFGSTSGVVWNVDRPFFIAACLGSSGPLMGFTLNPAIKATPTASTDLAQNGDVNADNQWSFFIMASGLNLTLEVGKRCLAIGSFRAQKSAADEWNLVSFNKKYDGFGKFQEGVRFYMPPGQNGATTGTYTNTGVKFSGNAMTYSISKDGTFSFAWYAGDMTVKGSASNQYHVLPYRVGHLANRALAPALVISNGNPNLKSPIVEFGYKASCFDIYLNDGSYILGNSLDISVNTFISATASGVPIYLGDY